MPAGCRLATWPLRINKPGARYRTCSPLTADRRAPARRTGRRPGGRHSPAPGSVRRRRGGEHLCSPCQPHPHPAPPRPGGRRPGNRLARQQEQSPRPPGVRPQGRRPALAGDPFAGGGPVPALAPRPARHPQGDLGRDRRATLCAARRQAADHGGLPGVVDSLNKLHAVWDKIELQYHSIENPSPGARDFYKLATIEMLQLIMYLMQSPKDFQNKQKRISLNSLFLKSVIGQIIKSILIIY